MPFEQTTLDPVVVAGKPRMRNLRFPAPRLRGLLAAPGDQGVDGTCPLLRAYA